MEQAPGLGGEGALAGRAVLVTGGGTGIGAACALRLAADGAAVTVCGRTSAALDATAARAADAGLAGPVRTLVADVTVESEVAAAVAAAAGDQGRLDAVVANAGGGGALLPYHLQEVEELRRVLEVNVVGTMLLVKHAVPALVAAGGGSFVAMSSIAAHLTHPYFGAYPVAKAAVDAMMRNAADEYGEVGVRFNSVRPGFTTSERMEGIPRDSEVYASYVTNTPLGGVAGTEDVAELVRFLVGPESRWITGQLLNVDGGHGLRRGPDFSSFLEPALGHDALVGRRPAGGIA